MVDVGGAGAGSVEAGAWPQRHQNARLTRRSQTLTNTPPAPLGFRRRIGDLNSVGLVWSNSPGAIAYDVYRKQEGSLEPEVTIGRDVTGAREFVDYAPLAGKTYVYRVVAKNLAGTSPSSASVTIVGPQDRVGKLLSVIGVQAGRLMQPALSDDGVLYLAGYITNRSLIPNGDASALVALNQDLSLRWARRMP